MDSIQIFISTSDKLDVIVFGLLPHTITANIVVGLDEYLLNTEYGTNKRKLDETLWASVSPRKSERSKPQGQA